jgi:hypothetical protein
MSDESKEKPHRPFADATGSAMSDTKRLEWLLETGARVVKSPRRWEVYFPSRGLPSASGSTARDAMDAAIFEEARRS